MIPSEIVDALAAPLAALVAVRGEKLAYLG
jgi:hypothetical protein